MQRQLGPRKQGQKGDQRQRKFYTETERSQRENNKKRKRQGLEKHF